MAAIAAIQKQTLETLQGIEAISRRSEEYLRKVSVCAELYALPRSNNSLFRAACLRSQEKTLDILKEEMPDAVFFADHDEFRAHALAKAGPGDALEFGVYGGYTISTMAEMEPERTFYGFDSFEGLPGAWDGYLPVTFDRGGEMPDVPTNVHLIKGTFAQTLPDFAERDIHIAFIHVDCDIYSSTKCIFDHIGDKLAPGCIIVFDEYFNYPDFELHERKAMHEFLEHARLGITWFAYSGQQCAGILTHRR